MVKNKATVIGFKATEEDHKMVADLVKYLQSTIEISGVKVSNSDVIRLALKELHKSKINNPKNRYGTK